MSQTELDTLKARAKMLGIKFHPNISLDTLRERVNSSASEDQQLEGDVMSTAPAEDGRETKMQRRNRLYAEANKLVRIRVSNMNPHTREHAGSYYTVSNSVVGTFTKYVPFDNEEGWFVPSIIYKHMKERECQIFVNAKDGKGRDIRKGKMVPELSIELLPDLTVQELQDLAQRQAMAAGGQI